MEYSASDYKNRHQLDQALKNRVEEDDDILVGTPPLLKKLHLKELQKVYGVVVTEQSKKTSIIERIATKLEKAKTIFQKTKN